MLYHSPTDFPGEWVVRRQVARAGQVEADLPLAARGVTLEGCVAVLRERHPRTAALAWINRHPSDDPKIVGCWV